MDLKVLCFCLCSYLVNYGFSRVVILDYNEAINEALTGMNISICDATSKEKLLAKKIVEQRIQNDAELEKEKHRADLEKDRADRHEKNLTDAYEQIGFLRGKNEDLLKPLQMLGVRSRLEQLANELWPGLKPYDVGLYSAFKKILFSSNKKFTTSPRIKVFRKLVLSSNLTDTELLDTVADLYKLFSEKAAQPIGFIAPIPDCEDLEEIKEMFVFFGIIPDESKINAVKLILRPLPAPPKTTSTVESTSKTPPPIDC